MRRSDEKQGREWKERATHLKERAIDDYEERKKARAARHSAQEVREKEGMRREERQVTGSREDGQGACHGFSYRDVARGSTSRRAGQSCPGGEGKGEQEVGG